MQILLMVKLIWDILSGSITSWPQTMHNNIRANNILYEIGMLTPVPYTMLNNIWEIRFAYNSCATKIGTITSVPYAMLNNIWAIKFAYNICATKITAVCAITSVPYITY